MEKDISAILEYNGERGVVLRLEGGQALSLGIGYFKNKAIGSVVNLNNGGVAPDAFEILNAILRPNRSRVSGEYFNE